MCAWMIDNFGTDEQRHRWLPGASCPPLPPNIILAVASHCQFLVVRF